MPVSIEVRGQIEARNKVLQVASDLRGKPLIDAVTRASLLVERQAKVYAPVDLGRLRASIASEVRVVGIGSEGGVQGVVGSTLIYAAAVELGSKPHWTSVKNLEGWARRHGMSAVVVQRLIAKRGTKARKFLQRAFEEERPRIIRIITTGVEGIVNK